MNYVKHLSLAFLVIAASPVVFAGEEAVKANDDTSWTNEPFVHYRKQSPTAKLALQSAAVPVGIPVAIGATGVQVEIPIATAMSEVKKAIHKAIAKAQALATEAVGNPEGSTIIAVGLVPIAGVYWKNQRCIDWLK